MVKSVATDKWLTIMHLSATRCKHLTFVVEILRVYSSLCKIHEHNESMPFCSMYIGIVVHSADKLLQFYDKHHE